MLDFLLFNDILNCFVEVVCIEEPGVFVNLVAKEYYVDDVYIRTFPNPVSSYILYTSETEYVDLKEAYEQGLITHDDLLAIAEAEEPRDNLKQDNGDQV